MAVQQSKKKKVSKKLKSSWRKHVHIHDVEEFLEDKRLEERLGPPLATITNEELFKIDTALVPELLTAKQRRKLKASRPLKCFSALQPDTKVPDPISKRNTVKSKEERKNKLVKLKEMKDKANGIVKAKHKLAERNRKVDENRRKNVLKRGEFTVDIWNNNNDIQYQIQNDEWANNATKKHNLRGIGVSVKNVRKTVSKKKSPLPAIELPHPGMSYNPSYQDHQDLLRIVANKESALIKEEKHLNRVTSGMFQKVSVTQKDENWLVEMSEGLPSKEGTNVEDNEASGDEYKAINPPVENVKKSLKQRRKQKEQSDLEKAKLAKKREKKKVTDIHNMKTIRQNIEKMEKKQNILKEKRKKRLEVKKTKTKILGSLKYEEPDLEFNLGEDLTGTLKNLKTEGNLLTDRFKSMQKRNILAPTKRQHHKKPKVKKYVKPGHKDEDWKKTVAR